MHNYDVWLKRFAVVVLVVNFFSFVNSLIMISEYVGSAFVIVIESMVSIVIIPALLYGSFLSRDVFQGSRRCGSF